MRHAHVTTALIASALLAAAPLSVRVQVTVGPTLAWNDDVDLGIGATVDFALPDVDQHVGIMADFLYFFPDGYDYWELNANATYSFPLENSSALPFALAGLNLAHTSVDVTGFGSASDTNLHLNLG